MQKTAMLFSLALLIVGGYTGTAHAAESTPSPPAQMAPDNTGRMSGTAAGQRSRQAINPRRKRIGA